MSRNKYVAGDFTGNTKEKLKDESSSIRDDSSSNELDLSISYILQSVSSNIPQYDSIIKSPELQFDFSIFSQKNESKEKLLEMMVETDAINSEHFKEHVKTRINQRILCQSENQFEIIATLLWTLCNIVDESNTGFFFIEAILEAFSKFEASTTVARLKIPAEIIDTRLDQLCRIVRCSVIIKLEQAQTPEDKSTLQEWIIDNTAAIFDQVSHTSILLGM